MDSPAMTTVAAALDRMLPAHEPFPACVVDCRWNLVAANGSAVLFTAGAAEHLLRPPINVLRLSLHPDGLAPRIVNLADWRAHQLGRLRRQCQLTGDDELAALYEELHGYGYGTGRGEPGEPAPGDLALPLRIRHDGRELSFLTVVATFGTPYDVTVAELMIESFLPADPQTLGYLSGAA